MRAFRDDRGFTLVEALVAMVVLSVGMLGIAALGIESLRASRAALVRTEAVTLATDMADRIRANRAAGAAYAGAAADAANVECEAGGAGCSPAELAAHDLFIWGDAIAGALPDGVGTVTHVDVDPNDGTPAVSVVTISWTEPGHGQLKYRARVES